MAQNLSISRTTVTVAYDRLWGEGFVTSRVGSGTFVSEHLRTARRKTTPGRARKSLRPRPVLELNPIVYAAIIEGGVRRVQGRSYEEQVRLFLAEAKRNSRHYPLFLSAILTGMRQGELLGLR